VSSIVAPERVLFAGEAGDIETLIEYPVEAPRAIAIGCHPHPLFGGSLTNKVIHTVSRAFLEAGAIAIRFNFRGVGASGGTHDHGEGETRDLLTLVAQARARWPQLPLWLGGFSFGSWVSLRAQAALEPALLVSVAPPVGRWDFSTIAPPRCPWLVIQGDRDELVDVEAVSRWLQDIARPMGPPPQLLRLADADHFFHGRLHEVKDAVTGFVIASAA
jgi:alpha/beta superfamily hydrolase